MLPSWFVWFVVVIRLIGGGRYAWGVVQKKARPNPATWFLWGITPIITLLAQLQDGFNSQSIVLLALGITPLIVCGIAITKCGIRQYLTPLTLSCAAIAVLGIVLWRTTSQPSLAVIFSIIADIFATLPTLHKAYNDPSSEYPLPYMLSVVSMFITLLTITTWSFTTYAFPLYMLMVNVVLFSFAQFPIRQLVSPIISLLSLKTRSILS
jgi:hypothetical protein